VAKRRGTARKRRKPRVLVRVIVSSALAVLGVWLVWRVAHVGQRPAGPGERGVTTAPADERIAPEDRRRLDEILKSHGGTGDR